MKSQRLAVGLTIINLAVMVSTLTECVAPTDAQTATTILRVSALELVDEHGNVRSRLNVESDGGVVFRLMDQRGTIRVKLGAAESGSGLLLANGATETRRADSRQKHWQ